MIVYLFDPETREYIGENLCPKSPAEPGQYLKPIHCLEKAPMLAVQGKARVAQGNDWQQIDDVRGIWFKPDGMYVVLENLTDVPESDWLRELPPPSQQEQIVAAILAVKNGLQTAIDTKAMSLGFSGGNALMLYVAFENAFQATAIIFATWEASVWVQAGEYRNQVLEGTQPMLTPAEAVAMMPELVMP